MLYSVAPDFHYNTGVVAGLSRMRLIPKMITVAVDPGDSRRDLTPTKSDDYGPTSGGADNFLKFMKYELIPFIEKNYGTAAQRLYWSHSIVGLFGLYVLLKEPDVFHSVLVSSPWMVYDKDQKYIVKNTEAYLKKRNKQSNFLYICVGNEPNLVPEIEEFLGILEKNNPVGLTWEYVKMPDERFIVFYSSRPGHYGTAGGDLYISFKNNDGTWKQAINLGEQFNKGHLSTSFPRLSPDGKYFFFLKLKSIPWQCEVFWISVDVLDDLNK